VFRSLYKLQTGIYHLYLIKVKIWDVLWTIASYPMGTGALSLELSRPGREVDHSPPSSAEFKMVELCLLYPMHLYGMILDELSSGTTLPQGFRCWGYVVSDSGKRRCLWMTGLVGMESKCNGLLQDNPFDVFVEVITSSANKAENWIEFLMDTVSGDFRNSPLICVFTMVLNHWVFGNHFIQNLSSFRSNH
jgi:hypothetical protein